MKELGVTRDRVEGADLIHVIEGQYELVLEGNASPDETSVAALGNDAYVAIVAPFQDLADLEGGLWLEDGGGGAAIFPHPVMVVLMELVRRERRGWEGGEDSGGGEDGCKVGEVVGCDGVEGRWGVVGAEET